MHNTILKNTPLYAKHLSLGARMVPFAGWNMPVQYTEGILAEHGHTRTHVSVFDICHMGEFRITGTKAGDSLDRIVARSVKDQKAGTCRYNFLLTKQAAVIDDLIVYRIREDEFFIVVNAATKNTDAARFKELLPPETGFKDESDEIAKIDLQGPESADILENFGIKKENMPLYYRWIKTELAGISCLLSRTGYTGELGFEIYISSENAENIWDILLSQKNVKPAGLGARDTLRIEMGYPLYGNELDLETTPVEAGFAAILKLEDSRIFPGSDILRNSKPKKKLVGIELEGRRAARKGVQISLAGKIIGKITSGTFSPSLEKAIALAYIDAQYQIKSNMEVDLLTERNKISGQIVDLPFYKDGTARKSL